MTGERARPKFDPQALLDAVDAQRRERGMTWAELSRELFVSTTTIRSMPKRKWGIELDGVIGLSHWVGRTVESLPAPMEALYRKLLVLAGPSSASTLGRSMRP